MIIKDKIYKFEFYDSADIDANPVGKMYANSDDIYALDDIPKSCFLIICRYKDLGENDTGSEDKNWERKNCYLIGEEITTEEAKEEFEKVSKIEITKGDSNAKERTLAALKAYIDKNPKNKVYLNKNIALNEDSIEARLILSSRWLKSCIYISPKQIINGRIYPKEQIKSMENYDDRAYIGLE